jgi:hypothetical protein
LVALDCSCPLAGFTRLPHAERIDPPAYRWIPESSVAEGEMESAAGRAVEVAPFHSHGALKGFVISGRWPDSTKEWAQLLMVAVRVASLPGLLDTTTVFGVREELPELPMPGTVGLVLAEGPVVGESAIQPGYFGDHQPPALLMLHPPSETMPSLPECNGAASGCVLLPGLPHLGLEHRAAWVEAEADGTITSMVSRVGVDPISHPDTAILAMLLAA